MKKKCGILGKQPRAPGPATAKPKGQGKKQRAAPEATGTPRRPHATQLKLRSPVHRQAADIVARLLAARATGRKGATVKGLCLAPQVCYKLRKCQGALAGSVMLHSMWCISRHATVGI